VFGCFRRLISLVILAVVAVGAYATRDIWLPPVRALVGAPPSSATPDSGELAARADTGWTSLGYASAERGRKSLGRLTGTRGPAYVNLSAAR